MNLLYQQAVVIGKDGESFEDDDDDDNDKHDKKDEEDDRERQQVVIGKDGESLLLLVARALGLQSRWENIITIINILTSIITNIFLIVINVTIFMMDIFVRKDKERESWWGNIITSSPSSSPT